MEILLTPLYDTTKNKTKTMSGITTKKNRRKSSLIITELPSPTNKIIVQDEPMAKDGIMEKPDASSENKMISDKNPTKETLPSKLPERNIDCNLGCIALVINCNFVYAGSSASSQTTKCH